jgi:hypothetical protein
MGNPEGGPHLDPEEVEKWMIESDHEGPKEEDLPPHEKVDNNYTDEDIEGFKRQVADL